MISFAGNLHAEFVQSLLGKWRNERYLVSFGLTGVTGREFLTMVINGKTYLTCSVEFSLRGEPTILTEETKERFPILVLLPKPYASNFNDELRLMISGNEEKLNKV